MGTVTGNTVLTLCDGRLAVPACNCIICGYVFVMIQHSLLITSKVLYFFVPTFDTNIINLINRNIKYDILLYVCSFSLIFSSVQASAHRTFYIHLSIRKT